MKHVVATLLSLSVFISGAALAAPVQDAKPAAPAPHTSAPLASGPSAVAPLSPTTLPAERRAERHAVRGQADNRHHRSGINHPRGARAGWQHRLAPPHARLGHRAVRGEQGAHRMRLGAPLAEHRQGVVVTEHRRHGLKKAPRGQEWRRIGERYVRVTSATNVVNEIVINGL